MRFKPEEEANHGDRFLAGFVVGAMAAFAASLVGWFVENQFGFAYGTMATTAIAWFVTALHFNALRRCEPVIAANTLWVFAGFSAGLWALVLLLLEKGTFQPPTSPIA